MELGRQYELSFADLLAVVRPTGQELVVDTQGHKLVGGSAGGWMCVCVCWGSWWWWWWCGWGGGGEGRAGAARARAVVRPGPWLLLSLQSEHSARAAEQGLFVGPWGGPPQRRAIPPSPSRGQGCLTFDSLHRIEVLLDELPDSYASKQQAQECGLDLAFCYANPIPG